MVDSLLPHVVFWSAVGLLGLMAAVEVLKEVHRTRRFKPSAGLSKTTHPA